MLIWSKPHPKTSSDLAATFWTPTFWKVIFKVKLNILSKHSVAWERGGGMNDNLIVVQYKWVFTSEKSKWIKFKNNFFTYLEKSVIWNWEWIYTVGNVAWGENWIWRPGLIPETPVADAYGIAFLAVVCIKLWSIHALVAHNCVVCILCKKNRKLSIFSNFQLEKDTLIWSWKSCLQEVTLNEKTFYFSFLIHRCSIQPLDATIHRWVWRLATVYCKCTVGPLTSFV